MCFESSSVQSGTSNTKGRASASVGVVNNRSCPHQSSIHPAARLSCFVLSSQPPLYFRQLTCILPDHTRPTTQPLCPRLAPSAPQHHIRHSDQLPLLADSQRVHRLTCIDRRRIAVRIRDSTLLRILTFRPHPSPSGHGLRASARPPTIMTACSPVHLRNYSPRPQSPNV